MGTHPIFESDFDCLTDESKMSGNNNNEEALPLSPDCVQRNLFEEKGERNSSASSTISSKDSRPLCRICHSNSGIDQDKPGDLITPCKCKGTLELVHRNCLDKWLRTADTKSCELCHYRFNMKSDMKPWSQWKSLTMTPNERNRLLMSITFHIIALACVVWSLFVLIDKTA